MAGSGFFRRQVRRDISRIRRDHAGARSQSGSGIERPSGQPYQREPSAGTGQADQTVGNIDKVLADQESAGGGGLSGAERTALHGGIGLAGHAAKKHQNFLTPDEVDGLEKAAHRAVDNDFYKKDAADAKNRLKGLFSGKNKKKTIVSGGLLATLLAGSIFGGVFVSGPLRIIQASQLLSHLHLYDNEVITDERFIKLVRFVRDPSKPQNTRMGFLGNRLADRFEARMNASGISTSYTRGLGLLNGYAIDPSKLSGEFADARDKSPDEVKKFFKDRYGIDVTTHPKDPTKLFVDAKDLGFFKQRALLRSMISGTGYGRSLGALVFRITAHRARLTLHPFEPLKSSVDDKLARAVDKRLSEWKERRDATIQNGADAPDIPTVNSADPENDATSENATDVEHTTQDLAHQATEAPATREQLKTNMKLKIAAGIGGGVMSAANITEIIGLACTVKYLAAMFDQFKMANVVLPLMRMGMELVASGDQAQDGIDADLEQMGYLDDMFYNEADGTSLTDARSIQHQVGDPESGPPDPAEIKLDPHGNFLSQIANAIPGLDGICSVLDNPGVQAGLFVLGFAGGPISASIGLAAGLAMQPFIPAIISALAGNPIDPNVQGATFGAYVDYGVKLAANDAGAASGGRPITQAEESQIITYRDANAKDEFQSQNLAYRLFNLNDYRSLASTTLSGIRFQPGRMIASIGNSLFNIFSLPGKIFGQLVFAHASAAATPYNYGFPTIATPVGEVNSELFENPYENASQVMTRILPGANGRTYIDRALACNGIIVGTDGSVRSANDPPAITEITKPENHCGDDGQDWARVRFYIKDTQVMEAAACKEGLADGCTNIDFGGSQ